MVDANRSLRSIDCLNLGFLYDFSFPPSSHGGRIFAKENEVWIVGTYGVFPT